MPRPLRDRDPCIFRLITIRTVEARLWLIPTVALEQLIGGIIARYQEILGVEIYAYCILSNHIHLIIRAPRQNADEFLENVNREIARRVNWMHRRSARLWYRRYDDQRIVTEEDLLEAFLYVSTNATRHGLIECARDWPGLCSYPQSIDQRPRAYTFERHTLPVDGERVTHHNLARTPLPQHAHLTPEARASLVKSLLEKRNAELIAERRAKGDGFLTREDILRQKPGSLPLKVSCSKRPHCYTRCPRARREFRMAMRERRRSYARSSARYRLGELSVEFPPHSYHPPKHRRPRIAPFQELSSYVSGSVL